MRDMKRMAQSRGITALTAALVYAVLLGGSQVEAAMPTANEAQAVHVLNRLAFGPRPGDVERVMRIGVDRYIDEQLHPERIAVPSSLTERLESLSIQEMSTGDLLAEYRNAQQQVLKEKSNGQDDEEAKKERRKKFAMMAEQTGEARLVRAIESPRQLEEVMVDFWFNHFNVFYGKGLDRVFVNSYERDAIRPYVLGNFRDLLGATARHPAMLFYLDNWLSTANDFTPEGSFMRNKVASQGAKSKSHGLNENYARELMELHTLGVESEGKPDGYSQRDVTELARMLTGWSFEPRAIIRGGPQFMFDASRHDKGIKVWLGRTVAVQGQAEGEQALDVLAHHPATARHIAFELAQYFVADAPPPMLVERLSQRFIATQGDIRAVLKTLFESPEFRDSTNYGVKFKTPYQYVVSAVRASGLAVQNVRPLLGTLNQLGMPLYGCQTPDGYKNTEEAWLNPEGMTRRINFATALASGRLPLAQRAAPDQGAGRNALQRAAAPKNNGAIDMPPLEMQFLLATLGPDISEQTRTTIASSDPALRAALVLGSPDFMRH